MKNTFKLITGTIVLFGLVAFFAFKNVKESVKTVSMVKVYTSTSNDYDGAIIICYSNGKTERIPLVAHKGKTYLENDKKILQTLNDMMSSGHNLILTTSSGSGDPLTFTTYIFEN